MLLASCHSGAAVPAEEGAKGGVTEMIASCGFETVAYAPGPRSFTAVLMEELIEFVKASRGKTNPQFSASDLHQKILKKMLRNQGQGQSSTPVYVRIRGARSKPSIPLKRLNYGVGGEKKYKHRSSRMYF